MWPFSRKKTLGIKQTEDGGFSFDITQEEKQEIDKMFDLLKGYRFHPSIADKLKHGITAKGLAYYAADQISTAGFASQKNSREECVKKAIASISKAYSIYQLPIYIYDLACYLEMASRSDEAKNMFKMFLKRQADFRPEQLDKIILGDRDASEAIQHATTKG